MNLLGGDSAPRSTGIGRQRARSRDSGQSLGLAARRTERLSFAWEARSAECTLQSAHKERNASQSLAAAACDAQQTPGQRCQQVVPEHLPALVEQGFSFPTTLFSLVEPKVWPNQSLASRQLESRPVLARAPRDCLCLWGAALSLSLYAQ